MIAVVQVYEVRKSPEQEARAAAEAYFTTRVKTVGSSVGYNAWCRATHSDHLLYEELSQRVPAVDKIFKQKAKKYRCRFKTYGQLKGVRSPKLLDNSLSLAEQAAESIVQRLRDDKKLPISAKHQNLLKALYIEQLPVKVIAERHAMSEQVCRMFCVQARKELALFYKVSREELVEQLSKHRYKQVHDLDAWIKDITAWLKDPESIQTPSRINFGTGSNIPRDTMQQAIRNLSIPITDISSGSLIPYQGKFGKALRVLDVNNKTIKHYLLTDSFGQVLGTSLVNSKFTVSSFTRLIEGNLPIDLRDLMKPRAVSCFHTPYRNKNKGVDIIISTEEKIRFRFLVPENCDARAVRFVPQASSIVKGGILPIKGFLYAAELSKEKVKTCPARIARIIIFAIKPKVSWAVFGEGEFADFQAHSRE